MKRSKNNSSPTENTVDSSKGLSPFLYQLKTYPKTLLVPASLKESAMKLLEETAASVFTESFTDPNEWYLMEKKSPLDKIIDEQIAKLRRKK